MLRYRKMIGAERVQVWTDVKKKHSAHAITADVSLGQTAETVEFMGAECVIVTGSVTGEAPSLWQQAKRKLGLAVPESVKKISSSFITKQTVLLLVQHSKSAGSGPIRLIQPVSGSLYTDYAD